MSAHSYSTHATRIVLAADTNQALGLGQFAVDFMNGPDNSAAGGRGNPDRAVLERTEMFHTDGVLCGVSALALGTNSPTILRQEALASRVAPAGWGSMSGVAGGSKHPVARSGATVFGAPDEVLVEKAVAANCAAVREWDSNGTNFGYSVEREHHRAGEFGHNDFYAVPVAAARMMNRDGMYALRGMVLLDEIRGRLAEVYSLKTYKIDHVVHGAIGSACAFGAMMGATPAEIEHAIGMFVAHHIPFRAIRHGHQLSDSKGASAAISTEAAVLCMKRAMAGFIGPKDIFRNPEAVFCLMKKLGGEPVEKNRSPFDLVLSRDGSDFAVMGMHFKLGLYEHQSAGALQGLVDIVNRNPRLLENPSGDNIASMVVVAYEPAFSIIGDPHKRDPHTRQSADHSMLYLVCTMLRKALELSGKGKKAGNYTFKDVMLLPEDFSRGAINHPTTRKLMNRMTFEHGGPDYDRRYPDGIPTSVRITDQHGQTADSGLVMYPSGHARNTTADLRGILNHKWRMLGDLASTEPESVIKRLSGLAEKSAEEVAELYSFPIRQATGNFDDAH
jgi:2-methylcitrate dehydratase